MFILTKTNAMRLLDVCKIPYKVETYEVTKVRDFGEQAGAQLSMSEDEIFKTLVTKGDRNGVNIFCIPINAHLDLKKAALVSKNKKLEMLPAKDVLNITGYMVGACTPIGMKKQFKTFINETAILYEEIGISAGVRGGEIVLNPEKLCEVVKGEFVDVIQ